MLLIDGFELYELPCPLGRIIGDNSCSYEEMIIIAICLKTNHGHLGWGYSEVMNKGTFTRSAWWVRPLLDLPQLKEQFIQTWWPLLENKNPMHLNEIRLKHHTNDKGIDKAIRLALWDLMGQYLEKPIYQILGGNINSNLKKAYGSPLDYHLSDEMTIALVKRFIDKGFKTLKIKIGSEDVSRDISRLQLVKEVAGPGISLTADANEAWTWQVALERLEQFEKAGIVLEYLEDPLYRTDIAGIKALSDRSPIPIIGNDYVDTVEDIRNMIEKGGIKGIRTFKDFDYMTGCVELSKEFDIPVYIGNSQFEVSVHAAVAFPQVKYIEFADLGWNELVINPVEFKDGFAIAPNVPGHGLVPKPELLHT
jgi:L-alanine-DL-glutamate epimerase-like enolase superfamily enzyme